ncbi:hypothetical protein OAJ57_05505, partial [Alphaproteobacteria bacterium]|nr:hypothetical protein [Alphaproteobacteria bacterium]
MLSVRLFSRNSFENGHRQEFAGNLLPVALLQNATYTYKRSELASLFKTSGRGLTDQQRHYWKSLFAKSGKNLSKGDARYQFLLFLTS